MNCELDYEYEDLHPIWVGDEPIFEIWYHQKATWNHKTHINEEKELWIQIFKSAPEPKVWIPYKKWYPNLTVSFFW